MPRPATDSDGNKSVPASWDDSADSIMLELLLEHKVAAGEADNGFKAKTWNAVAEALKDHRNGGGVKKASACKSRYQRVWLHVSYCYFGRYN